MATSRVMRFGVFELDLRSGDLRKAGVRVNLPDQPLQVLTALLDRPGDLVTRDELRHRLWPSDTFVDFEHGLNAAVKRLRDALGDSAETPRFVETIPRRGYRFVSPVSMVNGGQVALADEASTAPAQPDPLPSRSVWRRRPWTVASATATGLGLTVWMGTAWWRASSSAAPHAVPLTSLAGIISSPSLSPDGRFVVFSWHAPGNDNFDLYVQQVGAGTPLPLTTDAKRDYAPRWSPDGQAIAFLRRGPGDPKTELWLIPPLRGVESKIADVAPRLAYVADFMSLAWCPDSSCLLVTDSPGPAEGDALVAIDVDTHAKRRLTQTGEGEADVAPAVSPDGLSVVFRRHSTPFSGPLYRLALGNSAIPRGEAERLTERLIMPTATWMHDNRHVVFSAGRGLWRLDALKGGTPTRLAYVGQDGQSPVIAATADGRQRLVYIRSVSDTNVWRLTMPEPGAPAPAAPVKVVASTRDDARPSLSPDGHRLSFVSNRSGDFQIWVADANGAREVQLTNLSLPGFPRWSPDGRLIAFHADVSGRPDVVVVPAAGGALRILTKQLANGGFPSFSRDGNWVYFSMLEGSEVRVWKMRESGGAAIRVTSTAAAVPIESPAGDALYYVSAADQPSPLWRLPLDGGAAGKVLDGVLNGNFDVVDRGIYYLERIQGPPLAATTSASPPAADIRLQFYDFSTRDVTTVARDLGLVGFGLSASRDGREVFFARADSAIDELMVVDDFR